MISFGTCCATTSHSHSPRWRFQECDTWAKSGECDRNPEFMLRTCAFSCGTLKRPPKGPSETSSDMKRKAQQELQKMEKLLEEKNRAALRELERQP